jgi:hypothetical protein
MRDYTLCIHGHHLCIHPAGLQALFQTPHSQPTAVGYRPDSLRYRYPYSGHPRRRWL